MSVETASVEGGQYLLAAFRDVSGRKRSEAELMEALESVMKETNWFGQAVIEKLARLRRPHGVTEPEPEAEPEAALSDLTPREREVPGLMGEGRTDDDIAKTLALSRNTCRAQLRGQYLYENRRASAGRRDRLGADTRCPAVRIAEEAVAPPARSGAFAVQKIRFTRYGNIWSGRAPGR